MDKRTAILDHVSSSKVVFYVIMVKGNHAIDLLGLEYLGGW